LNKNIEKLNADIAVYFWSISVTKTAHEYTKKYIDFNLKNMHIPGAFVGCLLYIVTYFKYENFEKLVKFTSKIRASLKFY